MGTAVYTKLKSMYFGEEASRRTQEILSALKEGKTMPGLYLITFAQSGTEQLDIVPSFTLIQKTVRRRLPVIAGAAIGRSEAMELVAEMASEAMKETGDCRLQEYLLQRYGTEELR